MMVQLNDFRFRIIKQLPYEMPLVPYELYDVLKNNITSYLREQGIKKVVIWYDGKISALVLSHILSDLIGEENLKVLYDPLVPPEKLISLKGDPEKALNCNKIKNLEEYSRKNNAVIISSLNRTDLLLNNYLDKKEVLLFCPLRITHEDKIENLARFMNMID